MQVFVKAAVKCSTALLAWCLALYYIAGLTAQVMDVAEQDPHVFTLAQSAAKLSYVVRLDGPDQGNGGDAGSKGQHEAELADELQRKALQQARRCHQSVRLVGMCTGSTSTVTRQAQCGTHELCSVVMSAAAKEHPEWSGAVLTRPTAA